MHRSLLDDFFTKSRFWTDINHKEIRYLWYCFVGETFNSGKARRKENKEIPRAYREGRWKTQYCKGSGCHKKDGALLVFHLTQMMLNEIGPELLSQHSFHCLPLAPHIFFIIYSLCGRMCFFCDILRPAHGPSSSLLVAFLLYILLVNFSLNSSSFFYSHVTYWSYTCAYIVKSRFRIWANTHHICLKLSFHDASPLTYLTSA